MSSVRFTRTASRVADARVERTWNAPAVGQAGTATITLPRSSPAANAAYINPDGLSLVEVLDEGGCGVWRGVAMEPTFGPDGLVTIPAVQVWAILERRTITSGGTLLTASPGIVVSRAIENSVGSVATVQLGARVDGDSPSIARAEIVGSDPWSVLTEMMQTAGGDIHIDETGAIFWCGQTAYSTRHNTLLVAGGNLYGAEVRAEARERVQEIIATSDEEVYVAARTDADMTAWPAQAQVNIDARGDVLVVAAHAELEQRNRPSVVIEGGVMPELWNIRERDFIKVMVPWAGFTGMARWCRVLSRSLSDDSLLMRLQLQVMQPALATIQTAGAPARQKPPQRPGRDREGGAWAQRQRMRARLLARIERG